MVAPAPIFDPSFLHTKLIIMKNLLICFFALLPILSQAQNTEGRIVYLETLNLSIELSPEMQQYAHLIPTEQKTKMDLYFNDQESLYAKNTDPEETDENPFEEQDAMQIRIGMGANGSTYLNHKSNTLLKSEDLMGKQFLVQGDLEKPNWKIVGDQKEILGYNCILAQLQEDSTTINAWFTPEIPVQVGPSEFYGLPGAILAANFTSGEQKISLEAQSITLESVADKIVVPEKGKKVTQEEFEEIMQKRMEEMEKMYGGDSESSEDGNVRIKVIRQ